MAITWSAEHSVNVKEIDEQHKHFIEILNSLYAAVRSMKIETELEAILNELVKYAIDHFATEEKYFDLYGFELSEEHKQKHRELLDQVNDFMEQYKEKKVKITFDLVNFLEDWLIEHLDSQDKKYTECFNKHGLY